MNQLLEILRSGAQGASNAVAGNVSGPVDLITLAMQKLGVNVPDNAVGSSQWMREKGFMQTPQNRLAGLLGETAGMVGPALATQFAPQIARAANQGLDNLAAPTALNRQAGVIAYRAGDKYGKTADIGGPTFFSTTEDGAKPFARNGEVRAVDIQPQNVLDASRGEGIGLYDQFVKETNSYAGRGETYRPFWTAEHDFAKWLKAKGKNYDAVMFDEPTGIPSYAVYAKDAIK